MISNMKLRVLTGQCLMSALSSQQYKKTQSFVIFDCRISGLSQSFYLNPLMNAWSSL